MGKIRDYARKLSIHVEGSHEAQEKLAIRDALIRPFIIFDAQQNDLLELRKIASYDEHAAASIPPLQKKISHNRDVLERLERAVVDLKLDSYSLSMLHQQQNDCVTEIKISETDCSDVLRQYHDAAARFGDLGLVKEHPEVVRARGDRDAAIIKIRKEFDRLGKQIDLLEEILKAFQW